MKTTFKSIAKLTLALSALSLCSCANMLNDLYELPMAQGRPGLVQNRGYHNQHGYRSQPRPITYAHAPQQTFQHARTPQPYHQAARTGYTVARSASNPVWGAQQAIGNALGGLVPWYGVGSSPSYQRQATQAYGHMSGSAPVGGVTLRETLQY